jgi:hypothetical protein
MASAQLLAALGTRMRTVITSKYGKIIHEEFIDVRGNRTEKWYVGGDEYWKPSGATTWSEAEAFSNGQPNPSYIPFPEFGYAALDRIARETYAGTVNYRERPCLVFIPGGAAALKVTDLVGQADQLAALSYVDLIDVVSRLPTEVRRGGEVDTYQFKDISPAPVNPLPPDLIQYIKKGREEKARLFQQAARPY